MLCLFDMHQIVKLALNANMDGAPIRNALQRNTVQKVTNVNMVLAGR